MSAPSKEAAKITINLLNEYKYDETLENALKPDFQFYTPEDFLRQHFAKHKYSEEIEDNVAELFFKISKHRKFLEAVIRGFLSLKPIPSEGKNNETSVCLVFLYLLIIELNEFTKNSIEDLLMQINFKQALELLIFLKKSDTINKLYGWAIQIWDVDYVKCILDTVINKPLFREVCETLTNETQKCKLLQMKKITVPVGPRCLNRKKKFVSPEQSTDNFMSITRIPVRIKATEIPLTTYIRPIQLESIENARMKNRERAERLYQEAQEKAFNCAYVDKSEKFKQLEEKIEKERWNTTLKKSQPRKVKPTTIIQPKKTATVILREGARLMKLEEEEIKRYENLAQGGFNSELLAEWQDEMREEAFRKHLEEIEKKHLEGLLSYEDALIAKKKWMQKKKERAVEFRREKEEWMNQLEELRKEEQIRIQQNVERGKSYEKGAKEAMEHVKEEKHKLALETMEESRALKERWLKEKEENLQKKVQLIKEIKALQAIGAIRRKEADLTETSSLGLLYEMSLVELKERLFLLKLQVREEIEKRRAEIKIKKKCRQDILDSYQELIDSYKKIMHDQQKRKFEEKENKKGKMKSRSFCSLDNLRWKLYEKRKARIQCQI